MCRVHEEQVAIADVGERGEVNRLAFPDQLEPRCGGGALKVGRWVGVHAADLDVVSSVFSAVVDVLPKKCERDPEGETENEGQSSVARGVRLDWRLGHLRSGDQLTTTNLSDIQRNLELVQLCSIEVLLTRQS